MSSHPFPRPPAPLSFMINTFPFVYLARHGETAWSITGQHTGTTDLALTRDGEENAGGLASDSPV